jgi:hypothetical protein
MNLRLTDAGESGIRPRDVGLRCLLGGIRVQHGAVRCGQNCGHLLGAGAWRDDRGGSSHDPEEGAHLCLSAFGLRRDPAMQMSPVHRWNEINQIDNWIICKTEGVSAFTLMVM